MFAVIRRNMLKCVIIFVDFLFSILLHVHVMMMIS